MSLGQSRDSHPTSLIRNWIRTYILTKAASNLQYLVMYTREGNGTPLQYSCLENPMDGGAWKAAVHGVAEGRTRLSDFTSTFHFHALEKEMTTHSSVLAWRIPGTGEPGGLPSMGSHRVGHDWSDSSSGSSNAFIRIFSTISNYFVFQIKIFTTLLIVMSTAMS